jgi:outer membrane beta-barrel protein
LLSIACSLFLNPVRAQTVEFAEDELATESVVPVFDKTVAVKQRNIVTQGRFEAGLAGGINLNEAFYDAITYGFNVSYHFDESSGVNFWYTLRNQALSSYGEQLQRGEGLSGATFDASLAPYPESFILLNYQYTAYYGKVSLSKQTVMNLSLFGLAGAGLVSFGDSQRFTLNTGFGQKFYFTPRLALRLDLHLIYYQGIDPTGIAPASMVTGSGPKDASLFSERAYFDSFVLAGLVFLI